MPTFRPAEPHGAFRELFPDVFVVTGKFRMQAGITITRNMTVVKKGDELVVINSARLSPEGEAELDKLGKVKHVVRIGAFHGADDPYYRDRYKPTFWAPKGLVDADQPLGPGSSPIEGASVALFEHGKKPEAVMVLPSSGGILLSADCYQNWTSFQGCSLLVRLTGRLAGFGPNVVGGPWAKSQGSGIREDYPRIFALDFKHAIPGHGEPRLEDAKEGARQAAARLFKTAESIG